MEMIQNFSQRQTMQMGGQMLDSLAILSMPSEDLSEHLSERAAANPFISYKPPIAFAARGGDAFDAVSQVAASKPSLLACVVNQIETAFSDAHERMIALRFAECLEPTGWLGQSLESIALSAGVSNRQAEEVLSVLQGFEPSGLFARSLAECLMIQAREADLLTWEVETLINHLDMIADGRTQELAEHCDCEVSDIPDILSQIKGLNPKPGQDFDHTPAPIFPPDLIAVRGDEGWTVELNRKTTPTITVKEDRYADGSVDEVARAARRKAMGEAKALATALNRRSETLLRTAAVLVARQTAFLEGGRAHLTPLTCEDVAAELDLHASTVSRAISGRMIQTETQALPLKAFFSRAATQRGSAAPVSRDSAMNFVNEAVQAEDPANPLSDDAIVELAHRRGLMIARRTVAKYRSTLGLGSSYQRRRSA